MLANRKQVVIVKNFYPLQKDPRLIKLSSMLQSGGYHVTFLGWDRKCSSHFSHMRTGRGDYEAVIMLSKAPFGFRSFPFLPLWWFFELMWLLRLRWDVVHAVNFPSIMPAIIAARLKNRPVVYDIEDTYVDQLVSSSNLLRSFGISMEKLCMKLASAVLLVDEMQVEEFSGVPNPNFTVVYDSPPPISISRRNIVGEDIFEVFYAGYLSKERRLNIESVLDAIKDIDCVRVTFAGEGDLVKEIDLKAHEMPAKIRYVGWLPYSKVLEMSRQADLLFSLRDPFPLVQRFICGSKFLEAIMCGKPILVNRGTSAAIKVMRDKCGVVVDGSKAENIKEAILRLRDCGELCGKLGMNGRRAYELRYGWKLMKQRLLSLYSALTQD